MAQFRYKARGARGDLLEGQIDAASAEAVAAQLLNGGITPIEIAAYEPTSDVFARLHDLLTMRRPEHAELILFARQMYTLMKSGVPIVRGMRGLAESTRNPVMAKVLVELTRDLETGRELSSALARFPEIFSTLFQSMVRVGENTGRLDEAFLRIAHYLEIEKDTRDRVKSALRYPSFVIAAIAVAVGIINVLVIPAFAGVFEKNHIDLPWATTLLIGLSDFVVDWWSYLLAGAAATVLGLHRCGTNSVRNRFPNSAMVLAALPASRTAAGS